MLHNIVINSKNFASIYTSLYLKSMGIDNKFINYNKFELDNGEYRLPCLGFYDHIYRDNLFKLLGLEGKAKELSPVTVIIGNHNFDFYNPWIYEEINREFIEHKKELSSFIDYIKGLNNVFPPLWLTSISFVYNNFSNNIKFKTKFPQSIKKLKNICMNDLYKEYKLSPEIISMLNALLFIVSGVWVEKFPAIYGVRLLANALNGFLTLEKEFDFKKELVSCIKDKLDYDYSIEFIKKSSKIEIYSLGKHVLDTKSLVHDYIPEHSKLIPYIYEFKINKDFVSPAMNQNVIYVDSDKSYWFDYNMIYMIQKIDLEKDSLIRVVGFDKSYDKKIENRLIKITNKIFPNFKIKGDFLISKYSDEIILSSNMHKPRLNVIESGRFIFPYLGHEGMLINGLNIGDYIKRKNDDKI